MTGVTFLQYEIDRNIIMKAVTEFKKPKKPAFMVLEKKVPV